MSFPSSPTDGQIFGKYYFDETVGAWLKFGDLEVTGDLQRDGSDVYTRDDIVGTVSQSGGVPTGAIIERDSNANGRWIRFADGTQIVHGDFRESRSSTGVLTTPWTFPVAFVDATVNPNNNVNYSISASLRSTVPQNFTNISTFNETNAGLTFYIDRSTTPNSQFSAIVIGRWY